MLLLSDHEGTLSYTIAGAGQLNVRSESAVMHVHFISVSVNSEYMCCCQID